jgi:uncharacterized protein
MGAPDTDTGRTGTDTGPGVLTGPSSLPGAGRETVPSRLVETHTAQLLLLGDVVLKWKKPVDLGFVDFTTLEARERACRAEVELNRRLAPDVYDDVAHLCDGSGAVVEPVVVMRRMPDERRLRWLLEQGAAVGEAARLARRLAAFHAACPRCSDGAAIAGADRVLELWRTSLLALRELSSLGLDPAEVERVGELAEEYVAGRRPLFEERLARGHVRDGHGDLLAEDIFCLDDGPRILDCLDFDPSLREGDVLNDLAMLLMDVERLGHPEFAAELARRYQAFSAEEHPSSLLHFYIAYRAVVRAKVALLRAAQLGAAVEREEHARQAALLLDLSLRHLSRAQVRLVLVGGLPGSGKSTVAEGLSAALSALVHSSDLVRRELRMPRLTRYARPWKDAVYTVLLDRARQELARGWDVVLDATWSEAGRREAARQLARESRSRLVEIECRVTDGVAAQRLRDRGDALGSEADETVRRQLASTADPWPTAVVLDASGSPEATVEQARAVVLDEPSTAARR